MSQSQLLQKLTSRLPLGICVVDEFYQIIYWNEFFTDRLSTDNKSVTHENNLLALFPDAAKFLKKKLIAFLCLIMPVSHIGNIVHMYLTLVAVGLLQVKRLLCTKILSFSRSI